MKNSTLILAAVAGLVGLMAYRKAEAVAAVKPATQYPAQWSPVTKIPEGEALAWLP